MAKIAVDVALLPPENIMDIAIELNQKSDPYCELNKVDNFPHITLAMGVIDEEQINLVNEKLKQIASRFNALDLELGEVYSIVKPDGTKSFAFHIKITDELRRLHEIVMKELLPIFSYDVSTDMFYAGEINPASKQYVENFKDFSGDNFKAHITIKCKNDVVYDKEPIKFKASKLGLFHLGDFCTCRTAFGLFELK